MKSFSEIFGGVPAAVASAPGRVNLLGEHTDYNAGYVLPTAIPLKTRVALRPAPSGEVFTVYSANLDQTAHFSSGAPPQPQFSRYLYGCIEVARDYGVAVPALDIHVHSDVPIGVGLSSSAALEVAMLRALRELLRFEADDVQLARLAQRAEIDYAGVNVGLLDHMASSLLDDASMLFLDTRSLHYLLLPLPPDTELLIVDSGISRALASSAYNERRAECEEAARLLGVSALRDVTDARALDPLPEPLRRRALHVVTENARVLSALDASAATFGGLMSASHRSLSENYEVSTPELDTLAGLLQQERNIYGAKLTGAGFGGACVALCQKGAAAQAGRVVVRNYNSAGRHGRVLIPQTLV